MKQASNYLWIIPLVIWSCSKVNYNLLASQHKNKHACLVKDALVFYVSATCPICLAQQKKIDEIIQNADPRFTCYVVFPPSDADKEILTYCNDFALGPENILKDPKLFWAKYFDVSVVPTVLLVDSLGIVRYTGAIDDRYKNIGVSRAHSDSAFFWNAINNYVHGQEIQVKRIPPVGCRIR